MAEFSWKWVALGIVLYLATFGKFGIYLVLYVLSVLLGGFAIAYYYGYHQSRAILMHTPDVALSYPGISKVVNVMEGTTKIKNFDKRITGSSVIDENLQVVLEYTARDYIKNWYREVSDDDKFLLEIRQCVQKVFISFSSRSKEIDWMPYFTQRLVDEFASHIRLYRRALEKAKAVTVSNKEDRGPILEQQFFDLEVKMEGDICRDLVSMSPEDERQYLQDLSEVLLFLLLPLEDFQNKPFRYIIREVLVNGIFIPTIDLLSDPDYINSYIVWLCKEGSFSNEMFMTVIKTTNSVEELASVIDIVDCDIARWRSKDTGGSDDTVIKQNLNSLLFLKAVCEERIKRLQQGIDDNEYAPDVPEYCRDQSLFILTFDDIINNNIALAVFIEFMTSIGGQQILFFYLNVEGFRAAVEQQIEAGKENAKKSTVDLESLRKAATIIYNQYLSEKASSRIKIEPDILKRCIAKIRSKSMSADVFDEVQARVYQILHGEQYYEAFIQSKVYVKLLDELGFSNDKLPDGDGFSQEDVARIIWFKMSRRGQKVYSIMTGTPEKMLEHYLETRLDSKGEEELGMFRDGFLEDFLLTRVIFMPCNHLCPVLLSHYHSSMSDSTEQENFKFMLNHKKCVLFCQFVQEWAHIIGNAFREDHTINAFLEELHSCVLEDQQSYTSLQEDADMLESILEEQTRPVENQLLTKTVTTPALTRKTSKDNLSDNSRKNKVIKAADENIFKVYCADHTYCTLKLPMDATVARILSSARDKLCLERVPFKENDLCVTSGLSINGRLFITPREHLDALTPLPEQEGPSQGSVNTIEVVSSREMAYYMTVFDWELFSCVQDYELIYQVFGRYKFRKITVNLDLFLRRFNEIQFWVVTEMVLTTNLSKRVALLRKFIQLSSYYKDYQNLNSFFAILMGLSNIAVSRLSQTWEKLPGKFKKMFADFETLMDPSRNHRVYRLSVAKMVPPIIPFMPLLMKDMTFTYEGNKTYFDGLVNFEKMHMIAQTLKTVRFCRSSNLELEVPSSLKSTDVSHFIKNLHVIGNQRHLTQLSHKLEPRKT